MWLPEELLIVFYYEKLVFMMDLGGRRSSKNVHTRFAIREVCACIYFGKEIMDYQCLNSTVSYFPPKT